MEIQNIGDLRDLEVQNNEDLEGLEIRYIA